MKNSKLTQLLNNRIDAFKAKYGNEEWFQELKLLPEALAMAKDYIGGKYKRVPIRSILAIAAGIGYYILPLDLIPDAIPIVGKLDDIGALRLMLKIIKKDVIMYINWKKHLQVHQITA